ncbi:phosphoribosyltransferase-like protein [Janthinobacterium agaricidamnosum]|uniref:PRTase-CE domain-containing protein n=1 Tax=Janthinobacterium agaricidamnosum NBRC 102515 = DSM 9628 TaxID=1349767 RepID=W0V0R0_9BURK|nr:hypothetical protein [Janthinobacterium agaricidamnosum]CDG80882.1 hypothetical protein GJA_219 [Janthinobacterium agaricidamnosum NBRC 102515 = DSM 9628]
MAKLLVVCSDMEMARVVDALRYSVRSDQRQDVIVWELRDGCKLVDGNQQTVFWTDIPADIHVLVTKSVKGFPRDILIDAGYSIKVVSREGFFQEGNSKLERFLETLGMCWTDQARDAYESYDHRSPDFDVASWLKQFDAIGAPSLGKALLRHLEVLPTDQCVSILAKSYLAHSGVPADFVATLSKMGKSGAALSGGLRRHLERDPIILTDAIEKNATSQERKCIHVFEDGLWTGIELSRVLESLIGKSTKPKLPALSDPTLLHKYNVVLHFALATDIGIYAAKSLLLEWDLKNFSLATSNSKMIEVLTAEAKSNFENGNFSFKHVRDFASEVSITPRIITLLSVEMSDAAITHVMGVIRTVGSQLWAINNKALSDSAIPLNVEFGANGIGSTTLFRHSSPRAVLPMFWASGPIKWGSKRIHWKALFPENGPKDHILATS